MLSKSRIKLITSLNSKKYRNQHNLFVVEGQKSVQEFINSNYELEQVYAVESNSFNISEGKITYVAESELKKISFLKVNSGVLGVFKIPHSISLPKTKLLLALDNVRDPGNLGTIIRLCDWFGVTELVCSHGTADCYNPKVVQASMGSLTRVNVTYVDLKDYLNSSSKTIYGAFLDRKSVV